MSEITDERLTEIENAALKGLLDLVYAAWCLADDSEDLGDGYHKVDHANMVKLCEALDALDELPDDQPGYTMAEAAKAKWALRRLLAAQERRASSPAAGRDAVIEECASQADYDFAPGTSPNDEMRGYRDGRQDAAKRIRALKGAP